ncbi:hypothetical protein Skr01_73450 [Sphaerisporangium krabiense]|nr:hypothetical protein Skr01_73450 [Sphaerisporangium krabiense]
MTRRVAEASDEDPEARRTAPGTHQMNLERRMSPAMRGPARAGSGPPGGSPGPTARVALTVVAVAGFWLVALHPLLSLLR